MHDHDSHEEHGHSHDHHAAARSNPKPLLIAFAITASFMFVEAVGGVLTHSLALLADAGHMATDAAALGLALLAVWFSRRPSTPRHSFGFIRSEVLAAFVNAAALVVISVFIFWEAFQRFSEPPEVDSTPMMIVAIIGLIANLVSAWVLSRGGDHQHNLNTRGAFLHVMGDALGSVGAIVAAIVMLLTDWYLIDPILSGVIGFLVLGSAWRLLKESANILMESTPAGIDPRAVSDAAAEVDGVRGIHDLHIWTLSSGVIAASAHVAIDDLATWPKVLPQLDHVFGEHFNIAHATLQPEPGNGACNPDDYRCCVLSEDGRTAECLLREGNHAHALELAGHAH